MKIDHTAMYVYDLEAAKTFFTQYFDAKAGEIYHNEKTGFQSYFLSFDDGCRLELMTRPGLGKGRGEGYQPGYAHLAFSVGSKEKVNLLTEQLRCDGYIVISGPRVTGDGYYESCIACLEENLIEITV